jgi:predicted nucleic acid-binding protein
VKLLFVDTAGWIALLDGNDPAHDGCVRERDAWLRKGGLLLTSDYVCDETLTLSRKRFGIDVAHRWWQAADGSRHVRWELVTVERAVEARAWFFGWRDREFSFTDCTSFVIMKELGIRAALTTDRHFTLAGFRRLP